MEFKNLFGGERKPLPIVGGFYNYYDGCVISDAKQFKAVVKKVVSCDEIDEKWRRELGKNNTEDSDYDMETDFFVFADLFDCGGRCASLVFVRSKEYGWLSLCGLWVGILDVDGKFTQWVREYVERNGREYKDVVADEALSRMLKSPL